MKMCYTAIIPASSVYSVPGVLILCQVQLGPRAIPKIAHAQENTHAHALWRRKTRPRIYTPRSVEV